MFRLDKPFASLPTALAKTQPTPVIMSERLAKTEPFKQIPEIQLRAFETVPFIPLGQYLLPSAWRSNLHGLLRGALPVFWNITKA